MRVHLPTATSSVLTNASLSFLLHPSCASIHACLPALLISQLMSVLGCSCPSIPSAGLLDYMVDFGRKEVTVRGKVAHTKNKRKHRKALLGAAGWVDARSAAAAAASSSSPGGHARTTLSWFLGCYGS